VTAPVLVIRLRGTEGIDPESLGDRGVEVTQDIRLSAADETAVLVLLDVETILVPLVDRMHGAVPPDGDRSEHVHVDSQIGSRGEGSNTAG
jgi:hypothetical protein